MAWKYLTAAAVMALGMPAFAQGWDDSEPAPKPCDSEPYHAFDFWLGDWTVSDTSGAVAGHNTITAVEEGCLIVERWTGAEGTTGQSYNYYDPGTGMWRQVWVSPFTVIDYEGGLNQVGAMVLEGEIKYRNGTHYPFRGTWTPNDDGSVRQAFEQYNPQTETWDEWFTGIYRK